MADNDRGSYDERRLTARWPTIEPAPTIVLPTIEITGRVLAVFADYAGLQNAVRARIASLRITHLEVDHLSGNHQGYTGKLMAPGQIKRFGFVSLGNTIGALGCELALVEDAPATAEILAAESMPALTGREIRSMATLDKTLGAIGCKMALVEDPLATEKLMRRAKTRKLALHQVKCRRSPSAADA